MDSYEHLKVDDEPLTDQEKFILEQVAKGRIANLLEKFGEGEEVRQIRAKFLEDLLTGNFEKIKVHRRGIRLSHAIIIQGLDLENAEVLFEVFIIDSRFVNGTSLRDAFFKRNLVLNRTHFIENVDFHRLQVEGDVFCRDTIFEKAVNFIGANIGGQFGEERAKFNSKEQEANFNGMKVGQSIFLDNAVFRGPVNFGGADIGRQFNANGAQFEGQRIENQANFNHMKVGQTAFFDNAVFRGPVDFGGADIGRQFSVDKAKFQSKDQMANFNRLQVGDIVFFDGAIFEGGFRLADARVMDLMLRYLPEPIPALSLERTVVERELALAGVQIETLSASNLHVKVKSSFEQVVIKKDCDLRDSSFQVLNLHDVTWPKEPEDVLLEGLTYQAVSAGEGKDDWRRLLAWIEGSRFNTQNYSQLETYLTRCGHRDRADAVFITGKREAANRLTWGKKWLTRIFWGLLTGYGRKPWQVLYVIAPLVLIGAILFPPEFGAKFMDSNDWLKQLALPTGHPWIIKFLISLDRFLPGVDLGLAKEWSPAASSVCYFAFIYWYVLKLAGWITIPIALTAIYSRVK